MTWARLCPASLSPQGGMERGEMATLPHHTVRPSRGPSAGPAACSLLAVLGREGHTRKTLKFLAFTSVTNVYYFAPMW